MTAIFPCKNFQQQSASVLSPLVTVPKRTSEIDRTYLNTFNDTGNSGLSLKRSFFSKCSSPATNDIEAMPSLEWLKAGTMDDTIWLNPTVNIWCASALRWTHIAESAFKFARIRSLAKLGRSGFPWACAR